MGKGRKKRIILIEKTLDKTVFLSAVETQKIRVKLISRLEQLFNYAVGIAQSPTVKNRKEWMKIAGYIAQVINSLSKSYDETKFNEDLNRLRDLIEQAKKKAGLASEGTSIA